MLAIVVYRRKEQKGAQQLKGVTRSFTQHSIRKQTVLHGTWEFSTDGGDCFNDTMVVPQCWDTTIKYGGYRGTAWYRRRFTVGSTPVCRLTFHGVSHTATVFIDGKKMCKHVGAYTPFNAVATDLEPGDHELLVEVCNAYNDETDLYHDFYDWHLYGGIFRPVIVEELPLVYLERVYVNTESIGGRSATLQAQVRLYNASSYEQRRDVNLRIYSRDETLYEHKETLYLVAGTNTWDIEFELANPRLWSPEEPNLYWVEVSTQEDDLVDRFGIRTVASHGAEILLNEKPIRLLGFNRHEDHPDWGHALPEAIMLKDIEIIKLAGANFIRGSHYPNSELFLDHLDEHGILFWEESSHWGLKEEQMRRPHFMEQSKRCLAEMINEHKGHPCIIMWGLLNECASDSLAMRPLYQELIEHIRSLDSRPVTYASMYPATDQCLDLADIISINNYTAWYDGEIEDVPTWYAGFRQRLAELGLADRPFILSEFGTGAIPNFHSFHQYKWSEEYQYDFFRQVLAYYLNETSVNGLVIWQFCDIRTTKTKFDTRPRTHNNKGIVDEFRRPKLAFTAIKNAFNSLTTG